MTRAPFVPLQILFGLLAPLGLAEEWRQWRGPNGNGTAAEGARPPLVWSEGENVKWRVFIPGRGMSSPIVVGGLVIVTTATEEGQFVLAYDRGDGAIRWKERIHEGGLPEKQHRKNSAATPTPASDGKAIYLVFHNGGRVRLTALDLRGERLWERDAGPFECDYRFGYAPSPTLHEGLVILVSEFAEGGWLAAFRAADGEEVWRTPRAIKTSYSSPIVARVAGREQILLSGGTKVCGYDPRDGRLLWEVEGSCSATCGTLVWSEDTVFASGGFPNKETLAVRLGTRPEVLWRNGDMSYEQSLLHHDGHLYTFNDNGIAICWDAATGEERWKVRLGGPVSSSPILAGGRIYAMNERGITHVFEPDPSGFRKLAENVLGDEGFATPAFVDGEIFLRTATNAGGRREEWLYCLAEGADGPDQRPTQ
jgi:outer membrane protein assembly factor BamB